MFHKFNWLKIANHLLKIVTFKPLTRIFSPPMVEMSIRWTIVVQGGAAAFVLWLLCRPPQLRWERSLRRHCHKTAHFFLLILLYFQLLYSSSTFLPVLKDFKLRHSLWLNLFVTFFLLVTNTSFWWMANELGLGGLCKRLLPPTQHSTLNFSTRQWTTATKLPSSGRVLFFFFHRYYNGRF